MKKEVLRSLLGCGVFEQFFALFVYVFALFVLCLALFAYIFVLNIHT